MTTPRRSLLIDAYLERRGDLLRYFRLRLRSEEAAQDLVQDLYVKISGLPEQDIHNPAAYLYRLGSNLMLDQLKQRRRATQRDGQWRAAEADELDGEPIAPGAPADEALAARQRLSQIMEAIEPLPAPVRRAFQLHKLEGLSHSETAAAMGVSRSSVEKYLMTALSCVLTKVGR